jgi:glucose/arabinose dehydrogenase
MRSFLLLVLAALLLTACGEPAQPTTAPTPPAAATTTGAPVDAPTVEQTATTAPAGVDTATPPAVDAPPAESTATTAAPPAEPPTPAPPADTPTASAMETGPPAAQALLVPDALRSGVFAQERTLNLPPGFGVSLFDAGLGSPRWIVTGPDGKLWVTERGAGRVLVYEPQGGADAPQPPRVFAAGLNQPHGIDFYGGYVYIAETTRVLRIRNDNGQAAGAPEVVIKGLPGDGGHSTRTLLFTPDNKLLVSIGSSCNVCREADERRAAVMIYDPDGSNGRLYATGLRNAVGLALDPSTRQVWFTSNGRDSLGNDVPPETIGTLRDGAFYGWPDCYGNKVVDTNFGGDAARCGQMTVAEVQAQAHSAPLGLSVLPAQGWPAPYAGSLIVAFHGSWDRTPPTGYKLVWVPLVNGQVSGEESDFVTGFQQANGTVWGRPVAVAVGSDGALYVTDDKAGAIYRIFRTNP